ncbi:MAG: ATP-binding protein [Lachnospiraceae bacterium]|nr:ATP-binding protein [Lachnospiraceae bacterium]
MGYYFNSTRPFSLYESETKKPYFIDKSDMLRKLIPLVEEGNNHVCITRPRRFGKSIMAAMVGAFFGKGVDSSSIFEVLKISGENDYRQHMNQHNVIYMNFIKPANQSSSYEEFIQQIEKFLIRDLRKSFPDVDYWRGLSSADFLGMIHEETGEIFIFVLDEWDCIFHKSFITDEDRKYFINWLATMTKDTGYVSLSYMTGVLPIAKYSSGSTINNFKEYSMPTDTLYSDYFGFTDAEVDELYSRYETRTEPPRITREDLRYWYDGYHTLSSKRIYNPRSVVEALDRNSIQSYWTRTGPYSEISTYVVNDIDDVKKDVALMVAGEAVKASVEEFAATSMNLNTRNEILSAMVVYGFLDYEKGKVRIPNKELMDEFEKTIREREGLGYIHRLAIESERMLRATLQCDTNTVEEILQFAHDTETPLLDYNDEAELTAIVNLVYLAARDSYYVEREDKAGRGYVDFIFYPEKQGQDGIILELKVDDTPEAAIRQIKNRNYVMKFQGKMAEKKRHTGRILMVGIGYGRKKKEHRCKIEVL